MKRLALGCALVLWAGQAAAQDLTYLPPGDLASGSGQGRVDDTVYAPTMLFPILQLPAFANSQVYGHGGSLGPGGGQCDVENYSFPWRDNYCEIRQWDMPLCPAGTGHQGQDIRPSTCEKDVHDVVAVEDGTITNIGSYSVYLTAADGTRFDYLHMSNVAVSLGQQVQKGTVVGKVSNAFGGTPTTIHLHFNIRQYVDGVGTVYVPPYMSLVTAYQGPVASDIDGALEGVSCESIVGWAFDPSDPEAPVTVGLTFDGAGVAHEVPADLYRGDLCENLSFCDHGFEVASPLSLFDDAAHAVDAALPGSPLTLACPPPEISGSRRPLTGALYDDWQLSPFWDEPPLAVAEVEALPVGSPVPPREVWRVDDALYVIDGDVARPIDAWSLRAWRLGDAVVDRDALQQVIGADWPRRPVVVRDGDGRAYWVDVASEDVPPDGDGGNDDAGGDDDIEGSCGCRAPAGGGSRGAWAIALGLALCYVRRRGRTKPSAVRG